MFVFGSNGGYNPLKHCKLVIAPYWITTKLEWQEGNNVVQITWEQQKTCNKIMTTYDVTPLKSSILWPSCVKQSNLHTHPSWKLLFQTWCQMVAISAKPTTLNESKEVELVFVRLNLCNVLPLKKRLASNSVFFHRKILTKFQFDKYEFN